MTDVQSLKNQTDRQVAAVELYSILAEFFKFPTADFFNDIRAGRLDQELSRLFKAAGYGEKDFKFQDQAGDYSTFKSVYTRLFLGIEKPFASPVESVYKVWTNDPTAELPIAKSKGYLMGDSALHIKHLLEHYGLDLPEEFKHMPDHLTLLLELLAYIIDERTPEEKLIFIRDHFNWLDDFKAALTALPDHEIYTKLVELIQECTQAEASYNK